MPSFCSTSNKIVSPSQSKHIINWIGTDATKINSIQEIIDLAITSPPYLNAFDYTQIIKVESAWVGKLIDQNIPELRKKQVGHQKRRDNPLNPKVIEIFNPYFNKLVDSTSKNIKTKNINIAKTCLAYFNDIYNNLVCVKAVLKKGGEYHMVIGDNVILNIEIPTHKIIAEIAQLIGFNWTGYYKYAIKDHRTSIPRMDNGGKIKHEYVIILKK